MANKTILTFISKITVDAVHKDQIDEVVIDMMPYIKYKALDKNEWITINSNEYIESQTLNITQIDENNNVVSIDNINGTTCCAYSSEPFCVCNKCVQLRKDCHCTTCRIAKNRGNMVMIRNDEEDPPILKPILKANETKKFVKTENDNKENIKPTKYHIEESFIPGRIEETIVIDDSDTGEEPINIDNEVEALEKEEALDIFLDEPTRTFAKKAKKTVHWKESDSGEVVNNWIVTPTWKQAQEHRRKMKVPLRRSERLALQRL